MESVYQIPRGAGRGLLLTTPLYTSAAAHLRVIIAACAGVAGLLTYESYKGLQRGVARIPHAALLLLSALMTLFLVYNLAAGGNPPPKEKPAATIE